ncbi:PIG-L family deacetylase [Paenibacillus sp. p3-SID867]|uniref:PIG-L deacetylase family protein n=1 Tax=Paenibacillus sp. p3-SID867 TaxID=2916363 RepID=UPI0021A6BD90|nr:PIG-L family deacetylase [Paenibacillus sp. p3-SID867]MCT1399398.1 PIG-L family deacetylase [Paenibacillus sp. p3-SID867]
MSKILNVIVIAAHPDEPEIYAGAISAAYSEMGHRVKFVTLTDGCCGHHEMSGQKLVERRIQEAHEAAKRLGVLEYVVLPIPDGELMPTLEVRKEVIRLIRGWEADIVITFHPDGPGHVDNRNVGKVVRDAADFVANVPNAVPEVPSLKKSPIFLLMPDYAARATYQPDIVIDAGGVIEKKLLACDAHASQFYEFAPWQGGFLDAAPDTWEERREFILKYWDRFLSVSDEMLPSLAKKYGQDLAASVQYAEAFEIADYSRRPNEAEMEILFPMLTATHV